MDKPRIFIGTPWNIPMIFSGFCACLRNCRIPFDHTFLLVAARHVPDARNAICIEAQKWGATHILMIDADSQIPEDAFLRLWSLLEAKGHEKAIASGWQHLTSGIWAGQPGIFRVQNGQLASVREIASLSEPVPVDAVSTSCLLFSTRLLERLRPPWFSDLFVIREDEKFEEGPDKVIYCPVEYKCGQDLVFSQRMKTIGVELWVDPKVRLPHELMATI